MLHIAGGAYIEKCVQPSWSEFFGSGLRAAVALSQLSCPRTLHTYIDDYNIVTLESKSSLSNFEISTGRIESQIEFRYFHPLARPDIVNRNRSIAPSLKIKGEHILRFGMLEGNAVVTGERVVYDPQSSHDPRPFTENGSTANCLSILVNLREGRLLTDRREPIEIGKELIRSHGAEVAVVKCGFEGAVVVTKGEIEVIPVFKTTMVWPIGTGDMFSSIYAYHWGVLGLKPSLAATKASFGVAHYCETRVAELPAEIWNADKFTSRQDALVPNRESDRGRIYLAGPFFNLMQIWLIEEVRSHLLRSGMRVFSPFHDVGCGAAADVVPADIAALHECACVFAIADGLDSGTVFEIGYARAIDKPVIVFAQNVSSEDLKMLEGTGCIIVDDFSTAIYRAQWMMVEA